MADGTVISGSELGCSVEHELWGGRTLAQYLWAPAAQESDSADWWRSGFFVGTLWG